MSMQNLKNNYLVKVFIGSVLLIWGLIACQPTVEAPQSLYLVPTKRQLAWHAPFFSILLIWMLNNG